MQTLAHHLRFVLLFSRIHSGLQCIACRCMRCVQWAGYLCRTPPLPPLEKTKVEAHPPYSIQVKHGMSVLQMVLRTFPHVGRRNLSPADYHCDLIRNSLYTFRAVQLGTLEVASNCSISRHLSLRVALRSAQRSTSSFANIVSTLACAPLVTVARIAAPASVLLQEAVRFLSSSFSPPWPRQRLKPHLYK